MFISVSLNHHVFVLDVQAMYCGRGFIVVGIGEGEGSFAGANVYISIGGKRKANKALKERLSLMFVK